MRKRRTQATDTTFLTPSATPVAAAGEWKFKLRETLTFSDGTFARKGEITQAVSEGGALDVYLTCPDDSTLAASYRCYLPDKGGYFDFTLAYEDGTTIQLAELYAAGQGIQVSALQALLQFYVRLTVYLAHVASVGGAALGHVKNGGNVTINVDGTMTAAGGGGAPSGPAGGVLAGEYPNPSFAADMATQAELDAHTVRTDNPHNVNAAQVGALTQSAADLRYILASVFNESVDDRVASLLVAGSNITISYDDAAGTLTIAASGGGGTTVTYGAWQDATLLNSWGQYNTVKPGYRLVSINGTPWYVELRGECSRSPAVVTVMLTLASGYRPTWRQFLPIGTNTTAGVVLVTPNGDVEFQSGGASPADLTGVKIYLI